MKFIATIFTSLALLLASPAQADRLDFMPRITPDSYFLLQSEIIERPFHIFVRLPDGYGESDKSYPVIYLLDGGTGYPMLTAYYALMQFDEPSLPDAIIVGISYGGEGHENGNYRSTDYTAPSPEREHWGGAERYQQFLELELLPKIAATYRTDESRRILFGQSLAGQFVIYTATTKPDLFWGHIASNAALHRNLRFFLDLTPTRAETPTKLFLANGSLDDERFQLPREHWIDHAHEHINPSWNLKIEDLPGEYHISAAPLSFRAGMRWLFPAADTEPNPD